MKDKKMKVILLFTLILSLFLFGCGKEETEELTEIEPGVYIGEQIKDSNFIPKLTLKEDKSFEFQTSKTYTYNGQYHVDNNMAILTITEDKSFTFSKKEGQLNLNEDINESISKGMKFHLWGSFSPNKIEKDSTETN